LEISAAYLEGSTALDLSGSVASVAIPLSVFLVLFYLLYSLFTQSVDPFHLILVAGSAMIVVAAMVMAGAGVGLSWDLAVLAFTPWGPGLGYELLGYRHNAAILNRSKGTSGGALGA